MLLKFKLLCVFVGLVSAAQFPSYLQRCSKSKSGNDCYLAQARLLMPKMLEGIPEFGIEPMDPLALSNLESTSGTFTLKCTNVILKGAKSLDAKNLEFNWDTNTGHMRLIGNVTFLGDFETLGKLVLLPINAKGKISVKIWDLDLKSYYKVKTYKDASGVEHLKAYSQKTVPAYGFVKMHLSNILGNAALDKLINQVVNDNWRELMVDLGPAFVLSISNKFLSIVNKFYSQIDYKDMLLP